jgi:hypothetical protein
VTLDWQESPLKHGGKEEAEERKIASNAEIAEKTKRIQCHY